MEFAIHICKSSGVTTADHYCSCGRIAIDTTTMGNSFRLRRGEEDRILLPSIADGT
jgi:hypothetical protein